MVWNGLKPQAAVGQDEACIGIADREVADYLLADRVSQGASHHHMMRNGPSFFVRDSYVRLGKISRYGRIGCGMGGEGVIALESGEPVAAHIFPHEFGNYGRRNQHLAARLGIALDFLSEGPVARAGVNCRMGKSEKQSAGPAPGREFLDRSFESGHAELRELLHQRRRMRCKECCAVEMRVRIEQTGWNDAVKFTAEKFTVPGLRRVCSRGCHLR